MKKPRGLFISGNWKMNHGPKATEAFFEKLGSLNTQNSKPKISPHLRAALFTPSVSLNAALTAANKYTPFVEIGSQNTHFEEKGAFTGEISGPMLKELGIAITLVGHSERRQHFGETDETSKKRTHSLLNQGFSVLLCIGETRSEREKGETQNVLTRQLTAVLEGFKPDPKKLTIAYEPVWAIGTGLTATPEQAEEAHQTVRKLIWDLCGMETSAATSVLYGGSVTTQNLKALLTCPNIDGALVGGASVTPESFSELISISYASLT